MSLIPLGDTAGKLLSNHFNVAVWFIAWSRFLFGLLFVLLATFLKSDESITDSQALAKDYRVWLRGFFIVAGISSILTSLRTEPIADVFAAFFIGPVVSYFGAVIFLQERINLTRCLLLILGFLGVLLVVKPGFGGSTGIYFAVLAGIFYGCFLVMNRMLANRYRSSSLLISQLMIGSIFLLPFGLQSLPEVEQSTYFAVCALVLLSALGSAGGNLLLLFVTKLMPATKLAPLVYFQLIAATAFGMLVFQDQPDWTSWLGIVVIFISGVTSVLLPQNSSLRSSKP